MERKSATYNTDQQAWLRAQSLGAFIPPPDHTLMLLNVETSPLAQ